MSGRITIGADPEFFLRDRDTGNPMPVCGLLGGTKETPLQYGNYGLQEDNVMCEYNIPPVSDAVRFATHIKRGRESVMEHLESKFPQRFEPDASPARLFSHAAIDHPQARMFGCSPDFDAYTLGQRNRRIDPMELMEERGGWRFSGGHVHIGFRDMQRFQVPAYVAAQFADALIGLHVLRHDRQGKRRQFYGTPGRYRPTNYGIEYRMLSTMWTSDVAVSELVGSCAMALGRYLCKPEAEIRKAWSEIPWMDVRRAIETEDHTLAQSLRSYIGTVTKINEEF
jgi:hypothetical protein